MTDAGEPVEPAATGDGAARGGRPATFAGGVARAVAVRWSRWAALWDRREPATALALVRIAVGLVVAYDLAAAAWYDVVDALWATRAAGGIGLVDVPPPLGPRALWAIGAISALTLAAGAFTRTSAVALLVVSSILAKMLPEADRGVDVILRHTLLLLALSGAGRTLSLEARLRTGSFLSDARVPAWPRYLLVVQLASIYSFAGWQKISPQWTSTDGWSALYYVLRDPHYATFDMPALLDASFPLLRAATLATIVWERSALLLLPAVWARESGSRRGLLVRTLRRTRYFAWFVATGIVFHVSLAVTTNLGIFPWGCLALYPALFRPQDVHALAARARRWWTSRPGRTGEGRASR